MKNQQFLLKIWLGGLICAFCSAQAGAQVDDKEIVVEKEREIKIKPANKSFEKIAPIKLSKDIETLNYQFNEAKFLPNALKINLNPPKADADLVDAEVTDDDLPLRGLLRAGGGNYGTTYLEGDIQHRFSEKLNYGLNFRHLAAQNGPVAKEFSGFSQNSIKGQLHYYLANSVLKADIGYRRDVRRFYGYDLASLATLDINDLRQIFNRFELNLNHSRTEVKSKFRHSLGLKFNFLSNNRDLSENLAGLLGKIEYDFSEELRFKVAGQVFLTQIGQASEKNNRNFFQIKPSLRYSLDKFWIEGGINLAYDNDPLVTTNNLHLYPVLTAEYQLAGALRVYAGLAGELQRTSLNDFSEQNPFINNQNLVFLHTNQTLEFKGGLRGNLNQNFTYDINASVGNYKNLPFFVNSLQDSAKFQLLYEIETSQIFQLGGELSYSQADKFQIRLQSHYYGYNLKTLAEPWHRPNLTANLLVTAQPIDKLKLNLDFQVLSGLRAYNFMSNRPTNLSTIADLSLKADYLILDNFSAFSAVNNILGTEYQRFLYYPNQGINFLIGLTYGFGR
jgi:hypothetical protein